MGCATSLPDGAEGDFLEQLKKDLEDPKYNSLTQVCPECYLTGILYRDVNPESKRIQLYYCNCCQLNLCHYHKTKHEIKQPLRYD